MKSNLIGVVLAAIAMFFWGFAFWAATSLPYQSLKKTTDLDAASSALRQYFPEDGAYFVPELNQDPEILSKMYEQGPVAFVHMIAHDGTPQMNPTTLIRGFILMLITCCFLMLILRFTGLTAYKRRVMLVVMIGVMAALSFHLGEVIWWGTSLAWKMSGMIYDIVGYSIAGLILGKFIKPEST